VKCAKCAQPFWVQPADGAVVLCSACGAEQLWLRLPDQLRDETDALLRGGNVVGAIRLLVQHAMRFADAQRVVAARSTELSRRGEIDPQPEVTAEYLIERARRITDRVVAVEGCWDGDTFGWNARLAVIVARPGDQHPHFDEVCLGSLGVADVEDIAKGQAVAAALGVPFHFTQPELADIGLPRWWDNHPDGWSGHASATE
jgi:hypothetical protein